MAVIEKDMERHKKFRKVLIVLLPFLIIISIIQIILKNSLFEESAAISLLFSFIDAAIIALILRKYYNWSLVFILLIVIAILFKNQRWPMAGAFFTIGFTGLACVSMYSSAIFLKRYKHVPFLRYFGFSSSIILLVVSMGLLWKNQHWPLAGVILNAGLLLFIPLLFSFIFTLPGSNYINWEKPERVVFFRAVIIPMVFLYTLCVLMFVFPDLWTSLTRLPLTPFRMTDIDLLNKPGLF